MPFDEDVPIFFGPPFGVPCARRRPSVDDVPFWGIRGAVDEVALDGRAISAEYSLRYPTAAVNLDRGDLVLVGVEAEGESVTLVAGHAQGGTAYRVRAEPRLVNDGAESMALLSSVSA